MVTITGAPITIGIVGYQNGAETALPNSSPGQLGVVDQGLGSSDGKNCSTGNGLVEPGQAIAHSTGEHLRQQRREDRLGDARPRRQARRRPGGDGQGRGDQIFTLSDPLGSPISDNGCDSFACDNHQVTIGTAGNADDDYTRLVLAPVDGELALEGGGDYPVPSTQRTVLHLTSHDVVRVRARVWIGHDDDL